MKRIVYCTWTVVIAAVVFGCSGNTEQSNPLQEAAAAKTDSAKVSGVDCDIRLNDIHFTKAINGADSLITPGQDGIVTFRAGEKKDFFCDPNNELSNNTAPVLLAKVDNKKPFTLIAKVKPTFTKTGLYNAGVLYLYVNDNFWQKHCFEQDERGQHRIVTVRTIGTSDDNNHDVVTQPYVYMKISSDTRTVASYYSLDRKNWHMVRLYQNNYPAEIWAGISTQCPVDKGSVADFSEISLSQKAVSDFRMGND
ncbi:DUF1349 domain-containing protein [Filimonas effusa]|uniref:DUF1349 domain-containing protein n=1 Tax=Filimonas effusa TaxID=2508721 RepID=A0A4Q1D464_9BACT|nr:DUF1349 domain-containing protein [Filimonas effusa]RXK83220.1 DUF1349 domain-containing protein [Filimonas effusa]